MMKKIAFCLVACLAAGSTLAAENLAQITQAAVAASHTVKAAQSAESAARSQADAAKGARYPQVTLGANYLHLQDQPAMKISGLAGNLPAGMAGLLPDSIPVAKANSTGFGVLAALPLYAGGRIENTIDAARSQQDAATSAVIGEEQNVKYRAAVGYVTYLRAQKALAIARDHQEALTKHARDIANLHAKGFVVKSDLLAAQASAKEAQSEVLQAQNAVTLAQAALNRLLARPLEAKLDLTELTAAEPLGDKEEKTREAIANSTELAGLASQVQALESQAKAEKGKYLPQVSLAAGWAKQDNPYWTKDHTLGVGVVMKWTVFDGGTSWHAGKAYDAQGDSLREKQNEVASLLQLEVTQSFLDYDSAQSRTEVARAGLTQAQENWRIAKNRYQAGLGTNTEVLDAEALRTRMSAALTFAHYDAILAQLRLQRACSAL